ncbi:hypothetical protein SAMN05216480_11537 [Pustulibacterium marinum]|uniref:Fibronectin type-III domain-containing protein n=1 Tax=Pustulibacterium marinum TaxID=1224947 RepID=A0A1I7IDL6_9FLAO|nr:hypothetical protein [Pustulibacterium marinum]SFU71024.1 hypothetical protein SAMN05216480_11537 [Pustulibacterium marinum]
MKNYKVLISYFYLKDAEVSPFANHILSNLTGNTNFTLAEGMLTNLATADATYLDLYNTLSPNGTRTNTTAKNNARAEVLDLLRQLASMVNLQAYGDKDKLQSSGFPLAKTPEPSKPLNAPEFVSVQVGKAKGSILVQVTNLKQADFYVFAYTDDSTITDPAKMQQVSSKQTSVEITGLTSGVTYYVSAAYRNASDKVYYAPITSIVAP